MTNESLFGTLEGDVPVSRENAWAKLLALDFLPYALATGSFMDANSGTDGIGGRVSGTPVGYTSWMSVMSGILMLHRDARLARRNPPPPRHRHGGEVVLLIAYGIMIFAMLLGPKGTVSALSDTSVVCAADRASLPRRAADRLSHNRLHIVAVGTICIGHAGT